ncbi:MAG: helix-turn-helix transcriptional regulator, partial [Mycobacterium sp.]|nr:helix-turn-helix transcriptional regulator [Mycobacterium sp.]
SHQRVSQWESGSDIPSPRYLDALCRLYRTRPDLLGFGHDYSETPSGEPSGHLASAPVDRRSLHRAEGSTRSIAATSQNDDGEDEMKRRQLLRALAAGGMVMTAPLFEALRVERTLADTLLDTQSVSAATVDDWEIVARDYGARQLTTPLYTFLAEAMCDFAKLRAVLAQRQPLEFQRRLYRVMAQLAGLIATSVNAAGDLRETHSWFHTARLAAEETGDLRCAHG